MNEEKKIVTISDKIIDKCEKILGFSPSIIETEYYTYESLKTILHKHKLLWSIKHFNDYSIYKEGIINIEEKEILFYFIKRKDEMSYKYFCLSKEETTDSIIFYFNKLKKFKTV